MVGRDNGCRHTHTHTHTHRAVGPSFCRFFAFMRVFVCVCVCLCVFVCVNYKIVYGAQPVRNNDYDEGDDD